ncbi:molybdopterin molybdotransferase MoeA [Streptomyces sp. NPDC055078]
MNGRDSGADTPDEPRAREHRAAEPESGTEPRTEPETGTRSRTEAESDGVEEALALVGGVSRPAPAGAPERGEAPATERRGATAWPRAREVAARAGRTAPPRTRRVPLERAVGQVLAAPLAAQCDLPSFDTSAMDGWAVAGPGPWAVHGRDSIHAGSGPVPPLEDGTAVRIATGARTPAGATAVIRSELARTDADQRLLYATGAVYPGQDIRPRGQECRSGDQLLPVDSLVTPAVLGLAAAAGYEELTVVARPRVEILVLGDELLTEGLPHDGLIRDALGPMVGPWLRVLGAEVVATRRLGDDAHALYETVTTSDADLIVTTGGTAAGPVDHVHPVLRKAGAEPLVDGVAVRPGHPMLLAALPPEGNRSARYLVGLPGNPLAAVSALLTLAEPLLRGLAGLPAPVPYLAPLREAVQGHPADTRLVPFVHRDEQLVPLRYSGPAMLRGIAAADGLAVVPPGGGQAGAELEVLDLPWTPGGVFAPGDI